MLHLNPQETAQDLEKFIKNTFKSQGFKRTVIGISGGIDSTTALALVTHTLGAENVYTLSLSYGKKTTNFQLHTTNYHEVDIQPIVESIKNELKGSDPLSSKLRLGNIMARVRMIILYDYAKRHNALVCGTENRSEHFLGYFTRFGDEASDLEPLIGLYKTQVRELAKYLDIPQRILDAQPSANLWEGQTDQKELGFSYEEADPIIYLYCDKKYSAEAIIKKGYNIKLVNKVIKRIDQSSFKHNLPFTPIVLIPTTAVY